MQPQRRTDRAGRAPARGAVASMLNVGGVTPFTSIDFPGNLAVVVFVQGCPWRCTYCHNPHLQPRHHGAATAPHEWPDVVDWLRSRRGLIDAVVFSGGEPTIDRGLIAAIEDVRALDFSVGLHTAGIYPRRLREVLPLVDWVGFDVKAPLACAALQEAIVGVRGTSAAVADSLDLVIAAGVDFECRTTAAPAYLNDAALLQLGRELAVRGVRNYAVQLARPVGPGGAPSAPGTYAAETIETLKRMFISFVLRAA